MGDNLMVLNIAHRGFSGKYPENTLLAIRKAVELGVDFVEVDTWLSVDHCVFVIHDDNLNSTANGKGSVTRKTCEQIRKYRIRKGGHKIPLLEEVFPLIRNKTKLNIEIKNVITAKPVADLIKKNKMQNKVIVSSGSVLALQVIKKEIPSIKTAYIFFVSHYPKWDYFVTSIAKLSFKLTHLYVMMLAKSAKVDYVNLSYPFSTKKFIKKLHKNGFKVGLWTVNTKPLMKKLIKNGADGIITNHPDILKNVIAQMREN
jgi:glycerophosphoryl diester phosphodiesterase